MGRGPAVSALTRAPRLRANGDQAVFLLPGAFFGSGQDRYLRAAFANVSEAGIEEAVRRLAEMAPAN